MTLVASLKLTGSCTDAVGPRLSGQLCVQWTVLGSVAGHRQMQRPSQTLQPGRTTGVSFENQEVGSPHSLTAYA